MRPVTSFLRIEAASGLVLIACTITALILANSPWEHGVHQILALPLGLQLGPIEVLFPLEVWINDGLMTIFFFVVGLEVKREFVLGELRDPRNAALPLAAALGGMVVPAGVYLALQLGQAGERGWGIPMATDIAFVVGLLALLGRRVPHALRVLMLTLAIADDIGAVIVIAVGYTEAIRLLPLILAFGGFGVCLLLQWAGVRNVWIYVGMGGLIWLTFHQSGVHSTVAGVILGMITPTHSWLDRSHLAAGLRRAQHIVDGQEWEDPPRRAAMLMQISYSTREGVSPLERLERGLHPWVAFGIMPVFALANAGVRLDPDVLLNPVSASVIAGLVLGKPVGVLAASFLAVHSGVARLPAGLGWGALAGAGCLAGLGFTMALFIAGLALPETLLDPAKIGILAGSVASALIGMALLTLFLPSPPGVSPARTDAEAFIEEE